MMLETDNETYESQYEKKMGAAFAQHPEGTKVDVKRFQTVVEVITRAGVEHDHTALKIPPRCALTVKDMEPSVSGKRRVEVILVNIHGESKTDVWIDSKAHPVSALDANIVANLGRKINAWITL